VHTFGLLMQQSVAMRFLPLKRLMTKAIWFRMTWQNRARHCRPVTRIVLSGPKCPMSLVRGMSTKADVASFVGSICRHSPEPLFHVAKSVEHAYGAIGNSDECGRCRHRRRARTTGTRRHVRPDRTDRGCQNWIVVRIAVNSSLLKSNRPNFQHLGSGNDRNLLRHSS
jgi:hypothetical protein